MMMLYTDYFLINKLTFIPVYVKWDRKSISHMSWKKQRTRRISGMIDE